MRRFQRHDHSEDPSSEGPVRTRIVQVHGGDGEQAQRSREEPQLFTRRVSVDPYAAWLEQRRAERDDHEASHVRWVYRYRGVGTTQSEPARDAVRA